MTHHSQIRRLRREHEKAYRHWKARRSQTAWKAMCRITTAIVALTGELARARSAGGRTAATGAGQ